jgi:carboxyl-terminal processing protease
LLERLKKEGIDGLAIDLRHNSGGKIGDTAKILNLFIGKGPVAQLRNYAVGGTSLLSIDDESPAYDGPLVIVTSGTSASASEVLAATLQDYGRALIVGDERTRGKGSGQTLLNRDGSPFQPGWLNMAGVLRLTNSKVYRVLGGSNQIAGVESDIVIPSLTSERESSERDRPNALPYDEVPPLRIDRDEDFLAVKPQVQDLARKRLAENAELRFISDTLDRKEQSANVVSLNLAARRKLRDEQRSTALAVHDAAMMLKSLDDAVAYEITLDNVDAPVLQKVALNPRAQEVMPRVIPRGTGIYIDMGLEGCDPVRDESLRALADLSDLLKQRKSMHAEGSKP